MEGVEIVSVAPEHEPALPKPQARQRYVEIGELVALKQIQADAKLLDEHAIAIGPFARLDAGAVAAEHGKTRGAITNLFGSQAAFQVATMALALSAHDWIERVEYPAPADFPTADAWIDAFFTGQSARGPRQAKTSGSTTRLAPRAAASRTSAVARCRFAARSAPEQSWTAAATKRSTRRRIARGCGAVKFPASVERERGAVLRRFFWGSI